MALAVLNLITNFFYGIFGSGVLFTAILLLFFIMLLVVMRANIVVILMVIIPLMAGFVLNTMGSNLIVLPTWIYLVMWLIAGFVFMLFFLFFIRY